MSGDDSISNRIGSPGRHKLGLEVEEVGASNTSMRSDMAEVALSLRKLGEVSAAIRAMPIIAEAGCRWIMVSSCIVVSSAAVSSPCSE